MRTRDEKRIRSSLRGPALNFFSVAFGTVFLLSAAALRLGCIQRSPFIILGAAVVTLAALTSTVCFLWNRVGWIEVDVEASTVFVHTNELQHCILLDKSLECVEGSNGEYQSIAFRQGGRRLKFRYRNDSVEDEERWQSLPRMSDKIVPSFLVSSAVGRTLRKLVHERMAPRIDYAHAALFLSLAFSSARENACVELPN